ncbi:MAG: hypothetical protein KOO60_03260 [Gemmatimonadales bacterium]|nr:hypothetical protein [Gemmatimonadales bacterium]
MVNLKTFVRNKISALSLREQIILLVLIVTAVVFTADYLFSNLYFERRKTLREDVEKAEERILHNRRVLSREEWIHAEYKKLDDPVASDRDSVLTETAVLRKLSELAGNGIHVTSVVPRMGFHEGNNVMVVALDFEGQLDSVIEYMNRLLNEMPVVVNSLSLAPRVGEGDGVVCLTSIRIACFDS